MGMSCVSGEYGELLLVHGALQSRCFALGVDEVTHCLLNGVDSGRCIVICVIIIPGRGSLAEWGIQFSS